MRKSLAPLVMCAAGFAYAAWMSQPQPAPESPDAAAESLERDVDLYWEALARRVESGKIADTHRIVQIADQSVQWGDIPDRARLSPLATKDGEQITDDNRAEIAALVRGKSK